MNRHQHQRSDGCGSATQPLLAKLKLKPAAAPIEDRRDDAAFRADLAKLTPAVQFAAAIGCAAA